MIDFRNVAISPTYFLNSPLPYFLEALTLFLMENSIIYILQWRTIHLEILNNSTEDSPRYYNRETYPSKNFPNFMGSRILTTGCLKTHGLPPGRPLVFSERLTVAQQCQNCSMAINCHSQACQVSHEEIDGARGFRVYS